MKLQKLTTAWFPVPDDEDGTEFEIKHLRSGEIATITEATHINKYEFRQNESGELEPIPVLELNRAKEKELVIVEAVIGWKNMKDSEGKDLECTAENKLKLCRELEEKDFAKLLNFIKTCRETLAETLVKKQEAEIKN